MGLWDKFYTKEELAEFDRQAEIRAIVREHVTQPRLSQEAYERAQQKALKKHGRGSPGKSSDKNLPTRIIDKVEEEVKSIWKILK